MKSHDIELNSISKIRQRAGRTCRATGEIGIWIHFQVYALFSNVRTERCLWIQMPTDTSARTVAHQAPLSMGFSRQECWSGLPCPSPGDLPNPGVEPESPAPPALADGLFNVSTTWEIPEGGKKIKIKK